MLELIHTPNRTNQQIQTRIHNYVAKRMRLGEQGRHIHNSASSPETNKFKENGEIEK